MLTHLSLQHRHSSNQAKQWNLPHYNVSSVGKTQNLKTHLETVHNSIATLDIL